MPDQGTDRDQGVDFTDLDPVLQEVDYPITASAFVEKYGDHTIERTNADPIRVETLFEGMGEETFESAEGVRQSALSMMPAESVGRQGYSDRGGSFDDATEMDEPKGDVQH